MKREALVSMIAGLALSAGAQTWFLPAEKILQTQDYYAAPTWQDVDDDGVSELVLGVKRPYYNGDGTRSYYEGRVLVLKNEGFGTSPRFELSRAGDLAVNGEALVVRQDGSSDNYWSRNWKGCWGLQAAFGDIDGDGKEDLVLGGLLGEITVYRGKGAVGEYEEMEFFSQTNAPLRAVNRSHVALRDLDGDGCDELVVGYMSPLDGGRGTFAVYKYEAGALTGGEVLKDANGTELNIPEQAFQPNYRTGPSFADVDGDGREDLVTGGTDGGVYYFPATETNALGISCAWASACREILPGFSLDKPMKADHDDEPPRSRVCAADVTGDGVVDLLVGYADGSLWLARGTEAPGFHLPESAYRGLVVGEKFPNAYGTIVGLPAAATVTASGLPDGLSLKKAKDGRYYVGGTPKVAGSFTAKFSVKDADGTRLSTTKVSFLTVSAQKFLSGEKLLSTGCLYANPTWYDVDGDGKNELLVGVKRQYNRPDGTRDYFEGQEYVFRNKGTAAAPKFTLKNLDAAERLTVNGVPLAHRQDDSVENNTGCWGMQVAFGDVNGDGLEDMVQGGLFGELTVFRGTGTPGQYEAAEAFASTNAPLRHVKRAHVTLRDLDGDGCDELVVGYMHSFADDVSPELASMAVYKYVDGALTGGETLKDRSGAVLKVPNETYEPFPVPGYTSRTGPTFADVDGDGWEDLVTGSTPGGVFYFAAEATNGLGRACSWKATPRELVADGPLGQLSDTNPPRARVFAADVTEDGIVDLLVGYADGTVYLYRGTKTDGFNLPQASYTNLVAGVKFGTVYGEVVGVPKAASVTVTGLPAGLSFKQKKDGRYYVTGTPTKAQTTTAVFSVLSAKGAVLATSEVAFKVRKPNVSFRMDTLYVIQPGTKTNVPVKVSAECAYTVTSTKLPAGLKLVAGTDGTYSVSGKATTPGEKAVTFTVTYVTNAKTGKSVKVRFLVDNLKSSKIALEPHYDNLIAGVPVAGFTIPGAVGCTADMPTSLGLVFNAKTGAVVGTPKKPGKYLVTFTRKVRQPSTTTKPVYKTYRATSLFVVYQGLGDHSGDHGVISPAMTVALPEINPARTTKCTAGVKFSTPVTVAGGLAGVTDKVTVKGLPDGLAYGNGCITGVPSKAGTYTVTVSASNAYGWTSEKSSFKLKVSNLPVWARGTYNGAVTNDVFQGLFTLTVAKTGKLSGKIITAGQTYRFSDTGYAATDGAACLFEQVLTIGDLTLPVSFQVVESRYVDASLTKDGVTRTIGKVVADAESWLAFDGVQTPWKRSDAAKYALPTFVEGLTRPLKVTRGNLTLAFGEAGAVTVSGKIDGKKVSASAALLMDSFAEAQCGCFEYGYNCRLFVYLPSVDYFSTVEVTLSPGQKAKTKYDVNLDCRDICAL